MNCCVGHCMGVPPHRQVALCRKHLDPHLEECARRKANPFKEPRPGGPTEIKFNNTEFYWWRGAWRLQERRPKR